MKPLHTMTDSVPPPAYVLAWGNLRTTGIFFFTIVMHDMGINMDNQIIKDAAPVTALFKLFHTFNCPLVWAT